MPCTRTRLPVPEAAKQPHSMMLPPPCLTVGTMFFGLKASPFLCQTYTISMCPNSSSLVSNVHGQTSVWLWCAALWVKGFFSDDGPEAHHDEEPSQLRSLKHQLQKRPGQQQSSWQMSGDSCWHLWLFSSPEFLKSCAYDHAPVCFLQNLSPCTWQWCNVQRF